MGYIRTYCLLGLLIAQLILTEKFIEITYSHFMGQYTIKMSLGNPSQNVEEVIDMTKNYSMFIKSHYSPLNSTTWTNHSTVTLINWKHDRCIINDYSDQLAIPKTDIVTPYRFLYHNSVSQFYSPSIGFGLAFKFANPQFSLIHQLFEIKAIDARSFSFNATFTFRGQMYLGGIPDDIRENYYKTKCSVDSIDNKWGCRLKKISAGKNFTFTYKNSHPTYFHVSSDNILAPEDFFLFLNQTVLKPYLEKRHCLVEYDYEISCQEYVLEEIDKICFEFNRNALCYEASHLFDIFGNYKKMLILPNHGKNFWVLGNLFIKPYFTSFDYDQSEIAFYSRKPFERIVDMKESAFMKWLNSKGVQRIISFVCGIFACLGVLYVYRWIAFKRRKKDMRLLIKHNKKEMKK